MANIEVFSSQNGQHLQNIQNNVVALNQNSIVRINVDIGDVENIVRRNQAAVIALKNGEVIVVENYFDFALEKNRVEFQNDGKLYWAEFTDSDGNLLNTIKFYPIEEEVSREGGSIILPWLIGIAGVGGIIAAANSDNGHSSGGGSSSGGGTLDDMVSPKLLGSTVALLHKGLKD